VPWPPLELASERTGLGDLGFLDQNGAEGKRILTRGSLTAVGFLDSWRWWGLFSTPSARCVELPRHLRCSNST
jgi:hypothetical protein